MKESCLQHFVCPHCRSELCFENILVKEQDQIKEASLICREAAHRFQIRHFIPRFLSRDDVTSSFGFEWHKHPTTQFDSANGMQLSEERFFRQTRWSKNLTGQKILEVGGGAGRFTEVALDTGAEIFCIDSSRAVDANWKNNGYHSQLTLCQADLYKLPYPESFFDKVFCFGVLQHTPDVASAFAAIAKYVRPGGELAVDVYNKNYWRNYHTPIYLIRPITKRMSHDKLYKLLSTWVPRLLPVSTWFRKHIAGVGARAGALIPIANYQGLLPTKSEELISEYSILDTFDTLSPKYILPQRPQSVRQWFLNAGYENIELDDGCVFTMRGRRKLRSRTDAQDRVGDPRSS